MLLGALTALPQPIPQAWLPTPANYRFGLLRFSPDGRYILAQDPSGITVLTTQPLSILFQAPAVNARFARFAADSSRLLFVSASPLASEGTLVPGFSTYLEQWSIAGHVRIDSTRIMLSDCVTSALSPDGRVLACVDSAGTFRLTDVSSGLAIFEKRKFGQEFVLDADGTMSNVQITGVPGSATIDFSPDGTFVIAVQLQAQGSPFGWNLKDRKEMRMAGRLRRRLGRYKRFAIVTPERIVIPGDWHLRRTVMDAVVVAVPSGQVLSRIKLPQGTPLRSSDANFVLVRADPRVTVIVNRYAESARVYNPNVRAAATEIGTGQVILSRTPGLDVFGSHYVAELTNGDLGLYELGKGLQSSVTIPRPTVVHSPNE